ncbi:MAG: immunoglobulin domain-containing protein, partial [Paludibacteraceae bacterium]|nr:immunoglobulin domain-containing protein [Paludibacteraceae bacterium]
MLCAGTAWGADISHYATGLENGTTGMNKGDCGSIAESTDAPRTGAKCISTVYTGGSGAKRWYPDVTFAIPKNSYFHIIGYAKLESSDATTASTSTQAYVSAYVGGDNTGTPVNLTTSWQQITKSYKASSDKTGAVARFYRKHTAKKAVLFDDIVAYVSTNSEVDLTAPSSATSASGTGTELTWTCGTDANTGIQATMIWKRTSGSAEDLTLNNQGIYALAATEGPKVDQSGHWELIAASLAADATSYSGTFEGNEVYAIVHRDLAYNYSSPTYITIPDLSTRTLYLKPGTNWSTKGGEVSPRFAVYCFGDGEEWFDMEAVDAGCGSGTIYKAEVPARYPNCIFCRMNGDHPDNSWENPPLWNKTADLTIPEPKAGVYEVPNNAWTGSDNSHWRTTPLNICVSGTWLCFAGEQLTLTATSTGATHYQWYKGGTAESNKIPGATTATYINYNFAYEDAGDYYCKARIGDGTEVTSAKHTVKTLRMYFNNGRGGGDYGFMDLRNTDPDHQKATGMIFLGQTWTYAFCVADGVGHYYGCNNDNDHKMWSGNCTNWAMNADGIQCLMWTENGATYTFTVDYSNFTVPVVSVIYPPDNQAAGYKIYFDNSTVNWEDHLYYRIGRGERGATDHTWAEPISKVPGTANLYYHTTPDYTDLDAWHIADNEGNQGSGSGYSIYQTNTDDATTEIKKSVTYEGGAVTQDITIVPVGTHSTGSAGYNNHCEFYNYTMMPGMKTQNVMVDDTEHGTITV